MHCQDLVRDRTLGQYWERQFCKMARDYGFMFTPMQIGRKESVVAYKGRDWNVYTLPDVTMWTAPGQHHEIKHKNPTRSGEFGLERYRFDALRAFAEETEQGVFYTIHNHDLSGGAQATVNHMAHWLTANVLTLDGRWSVERWMSSWVNGQKRQVSILFWSVELWQPLADLWASYGVEQPSWARLAGIPVS